jgi:hypothetical protein
MPPAPLGTRMSRAAAAFAGGLVLLAALDQLAQHTALKGGEFLGRRIAPFEPPLFCRSQREALKWTRSRLERGEAPFGAIGFDAELGWCPRPGEGSGETRFDWAGCRIGAEPLSRERAEGVRRIATVGCSYTFGQEVGALESWPAQVDQALAEVEVANLGVGAYGIDQALLRLRRDGRPLAPDEVWLGIMPEATARLVNTYRPAQRHWTGEISFKPRFVLDSRGGIELVPSPVSSPREMVELIEDQERFVAAVGASDYWVARAPLAYAPSGSSVWHASALGRLWLTLRERGERAARPWIVDRSSEVFRLASAIAVEAAREAERVGARFRVIVLPNRREVRELASQRHAFWAELCGELRAHGITVWDLGEGLVAAGAADDDSFWAPGGHYSARGNRVVAGLLLARM